MIKPSAFPDAHDQRVPPHNFECEQAFLGAVLLNNRAIDRASEFLKAEHYAEPLHGRIYQACLDIIRSGRVASAITLKNQIGGDPDLAAQGGDGYLARLVGGAATIINAVDYATLIFELHLRRELIWMGESAIDEAFNPSGVGAGKMLETIQDFVEQVTRQHGTLVGRRHGGLVGPKVYVQKALDLARETSVRPEGEVAGIATGIREIDRKTGGLLPGDYMLLAGATSMGKSSMAQTIAYNVATRYVQEDIRQWVAYFTPEMEAPQLGSRFLAYNTSISQFQQRGGPIDRDEMDRLEDEARRLQSSLATLLIDDAPIPYVEVIARRCRELLRRHPLHLIIVDYVQLIGSVSATDKQENRATELSRVSSALKALAKDIGAPVIVLSQLNRAVESRDDKRPNNGDLRDSGGMAQDADVVALMYREYYYLSRYEPKRTDKENDEDFANRCARHSQLLDASRDKAEIIFTKTRHGPTGKADLAFDGPRQWFGQLGAEFER